MIIMPYVSEVLRPSKILLYKIMWPYLDSNPDPLVIHPVTSCYTSCANATHHCINIVYKIMIIMP
jgi:hypothetical protein